MEAKTISVKGARQHNLQDVSLDIPRGKLICFTGVSGSGKSSFAFDTLFAEGQRRYLESLSSYARQFLGQLAKPDVDQITGLSPAISIQQKTSGWNPRSTVGTITQIHDYLRVLFARIGKQHCPACGAAIRAQSREQIIAKILELPGGSKLHVLAPVVRGQKGEYRDLFEDMIRQGYARARVDGDVVGLSEVPALSRNMRHNIEIVIDRLVLSEKIRPRLAEAVEAALKLGSGTLIAHVTGDEKNATGDDLLLSSHYACTKCDVSFESPSPQLFSFNSPSGMCLKCDGMGTTFDFDPDKLVINPKKTFFKYAIDPMRFWGRMGKWRRHIFRGVAKHVGFDINQPWEQLPERAKDALLYGLGDEHVTYEWRWSGGTSRHGGTFEGVLADLRKKYKKASSSFVRAYYERFMKKARCEACRGARLNAQARAVRVGGVTLTDLSAMSISDAQTFFENLTLSETEKVIATDVLKEIRGRLTFLCDVGLNYLALDRTAPTLSGGESQRIRLASQIGAGLVGVLYILDEPSIGLHARDNDRLLASLEHLRDMGNTVIVVEHDEQTMRVADEIVDFGPGPGVRGGEIVAHGSLQKIASSKRSITGRYLCGTESIAIPKKRRPITARETLTIKQKATTKKTATKRTATSPKARTKK